MVGWQHVISFTTLTYVSPWASAYYKMLCCIVCVSEDLSLVSGSRWGLIWILIFFSFSFSFSNPNPSLLPCLWCWQCCTTIRQRFVNVFHQLHLCMFVCHCHCRSYVSSNGSRYSLPKIEQAWFVNTYNSQGKLQLSSMLSRHQICWGLLLLRKTLILLGILQTLL